MVLEIDNMSLLLDKCVKTEPLFRIERRKRSPHSNQDKRITIIKKGKAISVTDREGP
jgi:hypothetical protein